MIDPTHKLSIARQAKALGIARSTVYYKPAPISDSDLALMAVMDRLHLDYPFAGARMLRRKGSAVGRARVARLINKMGIERSTANPTPVGVILLTRSIRTSSETWLLCDPTRLLKSHHIQISMDGKGCWRDNVNIERFWRTVKYEEVYLKAYQTTSEARTQLTQYIRFYNEMRGHRALNGQTPDSVYFNCPFAAKAA